MEITEETLTDEIFGQAEEELLKEAWPLSPEEYAREYADYLDEIGVRI